MSDNFNVLIHNKNDLIDRLQKMLTPQIEIGFYSIYNNTLKKNKVNKYLLREFQKELENTPHWSQLILDGEFERIKEETHCDWLEDLIKNIFTINAEILSSSSNKSLQKNKLVITIPTPEIFIHKCYIDISRIIWKNPQLFYHKVSTRQIIENKLKITEIIKLTIKDTLLEVMPIQDFIISDKNTGHNKEIDINENESTDEESYESDENNDDDEDDENNDSDENEENEENTRQEGGSTKNDVITTDYNSDYDDDTASIVDNSVVSDKEPYIQDIIKDEEHTEKFEPTENHKDKFFDNLDENRFDSEPISDVPYLSHVPQIVRNKIITEDFANKPDEVLPIIKDNNLVDKHNDNFKHQIETNLENNSNETATNESNNNNDNEVNNKPYVSELIENHNNNFKEQVDLPLNNSNNNEKSLTEIRENRMDDLSDKTDNPKSTIIESLPIESSNDDNTAIIVRNVDVPIANSTDFVEVNDTPINNNSLSNNSIVDSYKIDKLPVHEVDAPLEAINNNQDDISKLFSVKNEMTTPVILNTHNTAKIANITNENKLPDLINKVENHHDEKNNEDISELFSIKKEDTNPLNEKIVEINMNEPKKSKKELRESKTKRNNEKISNLLGIDIDYHDFVKNKDKIKKILLSKSMDTF